MLQTGLNVFNVVCVYYFDVGGTTINQLLTKKIQLWQI
nr:MAG TPA: hypothetical protein [Caudoviricetes sp.]